MHVTAGKTPHKPGIDSSEHQFAFFGAFACAGNILENPAYFGGAEIGVGYKTGFLAYHIRQTAGLEFVTEIGGTPVLPHNGVVYRFFGVAVPYYCGFSLVSYSNRGDIQTVYAYCRYCLGDYGSLRRPYFVRFVFHPTGFGKILGEFFLCNGAYFAVVVEYYGAGAAGALVQCENIFVSHDIRCCALYEGLFLGKNIIIRHNKQVPGQ